MNENRDFTKVIIDKNKAEKRENLRYRGWGMVSANNSSRLLLDYKENFPGIYWQLLTLMFDTHGLDINHLKIEMGSDINSSSGTEPCTMRFSDEKCDVTRGAGFILCADAKKIRPDLTIDMLWWSEPKWVSDSKDVYASRYKWYKANLDQAYETYGLKFDCVSAVQNERNIDYEWIKYLKKSLLNEKDCAYDYSKIKISAADEVGLWNLADKMIEDEELRNSVDFVGSHYTSFSSENAKKLAFEYGKELWHSEGSSPMTFSQGTFHYDSSKSGMNDINGILDVANRIIAQYPNGKLTLCQFQPVISSYYDGVTYFQKQFILANTPWNGSFLLDSGFYMSLHFTRFIKKGWCFINDACFCDGKPVGDGHAIGEVNHSYLTAMNLETGDFSIVLTNTTSKTLEYEFSLKNMQKSYSFLNSIETCPPDNKKESLYNENYFKNSAKIQIKDDKFFVNVKPYSLLTLTTLNEVFESDAKIIDEVGKNTIMNLPYSDDFLYSEKPEDFLAKRGNSPLYFTDQGGAFEIVQISEEKKSFNAVMQKVKFLDKANEWGATSEPCSNFGDDRWCDYSVNAKVKVVSSKDSKRKSYAGIGLRYVLSTSGRSGYWICVTEDGLWKLFKNNDCVKSGKIKNFDLKKWQNLKIKADKKTICAFVNQKKVVKIKDEKSFLSSGRAAFMSSWDNNYFCNLFIKPVRKNYGIKRIDNTESQFEYVGNWIHETTGSFNNYRRTISYGKKDSFVEISFEGKSICLYGIQNQESKIQIYAGRKNYGIKKIEKSFFRAGIFRLDFKNKKKRKIKIKILEGELSVDFAEIF